MKERASLLAVLIFVTLLIVCTHATSAVVAVVETDTGTILFHDTPGPCTGNARFAEYITTDGQTRIGGCFLSSGMAVRVVFLDGDVVQIPAGELKKPRST